LEHSGQQAENSANGGYSVLGNVFANVITKGIEIAGNALKNFTQDVIATGEEYESAISNVVAISGAMAEEVEMLQAKAEEMGATTKFTASESAEAMSYMAMAGWKVNDMISGLDGIMDLSSASGESLASVSDIVTDALTALGLQASDSAHFADVLAAASSNANTNVAMMGETFKYAAPVAGALGFSIEDTAEAIGLMANSGIKASQAGTALRTIMTNLSHDMIIYGKAFESAENAEGAYTITTANADGTMRKFSDILTDLREGWEKLTQAEQASNASMETVAGKHAMSGFLALMNSAPADIEKLSNAIENADGTAKNMAETMLDNLQGDKTLLESAVDGMKIAISKEINPALRELVQYATSQIPKLHKAIDPVADFVTNAIKNLPKLVDNVQKLTPVLTSIGTAVGTIGISKIAENLINKLIPAVKLTYSAISAHPFIAVLTAVGALTAGFIAYKNAQLDVKSESELLIEKHNEELQLLADKRQAIRDLNDTFYENVDGIETQTDRTKDLWSELDKLADQYGNVQQKDKARAEYILNELNEALGTEYKMTGNQIEGYKQLSAEIDNIIAKKQAEMMLDSYLANSNEMNKQRIEARSDYENANKDYQEKHKILEDARKEYEEVSGESWKNLTKEVDKTKAFNIIDADSFTYSDPEKYAEVAKKLWSADSEERQARILKNEAEKNYQATSEYFDKLDDLQEAYSLGQYDRMAEIIYAEKDLTSTTLDESATDAEQRLEIYSDNLQKIHSDFQLAVKDMRQKSVDELEKDFNNLMQSGMVAGVDPLKTLDELDFQQKVKDFQKKGLDISPLINSLVDTGVTPAEVFGSDWQEIFKTQLKNGGNMESMLKWLNNSDYTVSIPLVFGNNKDFIKYIKEQSAQGLDVSSLLELGAKSGLAESEEFVKIFKSQVSKNLEKDWDVGNLLEVGNKVGISCAEEFAESYGKQMQILKDNDIDLTTFIQWAEANGKTIAQVFGENFKNELSAYMKQKTKKTFNVLQESKNPFVDFFYTDDYLTNKLIKTFENGEDISKLVKQAEKQGLKVGDVFGDNYTDVIQQQIDKGYSIDELLEWGEISGGDTGNTLGKYYTSEVQKFVDNGFSVDSLLEWARNAGYKAGEVFGEKFREISEQYIELQEKTDYIRQEIADSGFYGNFFYGNKNLKFMADGGFLSNGQAVVAEAGPELLEIVNGGVRVTPLSENSRNTAVNSDGGQKVFYSNYTINATIASSYDVSRLAEELETERRRIERGAGK
ncbi:MAG: phage tail tape measure protein, partial [Ruminococcus sp.]|nr:phage tail tape measure protein [Ruminococcus sp.]